MTVSDKCRMTVPSLAGVAPVVSKKVVDLGAGDLRATLGELGPAGGALDQAPGGERRPERGVVRVVDRAALRRRDQHAPHGVDVGFA